MQISRSASLSFQTDPKLVVGITSSTLKVHILELIPQVIARAKEAGWESLREIPVKPQKAVTMLPPVVAAHMPRRLEIPKEERGRCG